MKWMDQVAQRSISFFAKSWRRLLECFFVRPFALAGLVFAHQDVPAAANIRRASLEMDEGAGSPGRKSRSILSNAGPSQNGEQVSLEWFRTHAIVPCIANFENNSLRDSSSFGSRPSEHRTQSGFK
jgi:hypothetical protein